MREKFIGLALSAMLFALCTAAGAQQPNKMPRIGYLSLASQPGLREEEFIQGLRDLGWIDGQSISIEYRWAAGNVARLPALAEELVRLKLDLIVAGATPAIQAAKNATSTIPIVMPSAADPVGTGLCRQLGATGRECYGSVAHAPRSSGEAVGAAQGTSSKAFPGGVSRLCARYGPAAIPEGSRGRCPEFQDAVSPR